MDLKLLLSLLSLLLIWQGNCDPKLVYKMKKIECSNNPLLILKPNCIVKAINWNKAVAQMDCDLLRPLRNISVRLRAFKQDYNNQYHPFLIDVTLNMCKVMSRTNFPTYGTIIRKITNQFTNFNHSCPFEGRLSARDLYIDEKLLPLFPLGFYKFSIFITEIYNNDRDFVGEINLYVNAMEMVRENRRQNKKNKNGSMNIISPSTVNFLN